MLQKYFPQNDTNRKKSEQNKTSERKTKNKKPMAQLFTCADDTWDCKCKLYTQIKRENVVNKERDGGKKN